MSGQTGRPEASEVMSPAASSYSSHGRSRGQSSAGHASDKNASPASPVDHDKDESPSTPTPRRSWTTRIRERAQQNITHEESTIPLAWQALLTGLVDALIYSRSQIWTGFQTGNMVQFSQNIAQYMLPTAERFPLLTLERALSVLAFIVGSFTGSTLGNRFGHSRRAWVAMSAVIQSLLLFGASAILLSRPEAELPSFQYWPPVIVLTSFSMGMQSVAAQKLSSPAFATTVAFTATLTQIASDPFLFHLSLAPVEEVRAKWADHRRKCADTLEGQTPSSTEAATTPPQQQRSKPKTLGRDRRMLGIFALCTGAGIAECFLYSAAGLRGGLTIAAGFKMVQALLWFVAPDGRPASAAK